MNNELYEKYIELLLDELKPAMGCTEPIALSYVSAKVRSVLGTLPTKTRLEVCGNIIKNVKSVTVPQTNGLKGIETAIAAGYFANNADNGLEVLSSLKPCQLGELKEYLDMKNIEIIPSTKPYKFYIDITATDGKNTARVVVVNSHTNIVSIEYNDEVIYSLKKEVEERRNHNFDLLNVESIIDFANNVDLTPLRDVLNKQISYNLAIANEGLKNNYGANIGKVLLQTYGDDVNIKARAYAAAASDARMSGCALPVMIISGSGNQGITASLPVYIFAKHWNKSEDEMLRALIVSDLVTLLQKRGIGRLSAFCGATVAGIGAAAGVAYLDGGRYKEISHTVVNALGIISGMICDGAKASCAAKISAAIDSGLFGYYMYKNNQQFRSGDGIITKGVDLTIENVGKMARDGMGKTDEEILKIMVGNGCVD